MILALDLGTTVTKASLWGAAGMVGMAEEALVTSYPAPRWAEQDSARWWTSVVSACARLADQLPGGLTGVAAVTCTGARQSFGLFDGDGRPLGPGILWSDRRDVEGGAAAPAAVRSPDPGPVAAKLAWVAAHRRDDWDRSVWVLAPRDVVVWRLTGRVVTDPSLASCTGLYDDGGRVVAGDDGVAERLAPVVPSDEVTGALTAAAAAELGPDAGTPVVIGAGDRACEVLGCGATGARPMVSWGTTANVSFPRPHRPEPGPPGLSVSRATGGGWLVEGGLSAAGSLLAWLASVCGHTPDELAALAGTCPPGARGVTAVPWLGGARAPWWRPGAGAGLVGLDGSHGPAELARAVFEAVARDVDRCLDLAVEGPAGAPRVTGLHLTGSGVAAPVWREVLAGVTGCTVSWRRSGQAASAGAVLLAASAVGLDWSVDGIDPRAGTLDADPDLVAGYAALRPAADTAAAALLGLAGGRGGFASA